MPQGIGNLFVGFGEGFGKSYFRQKQQKHEEELAHEANQYKMMQDALHTATQRGDTNAVAHIFRSMEEFASHSSGTKGGKGKKGKEARGGILSKFADMLEGGKQTEESKQAGQQNEGKPPEQQERPRRALTQPLMQSNQQLSEEENQTALRKQQLLAPGIRAEKEAEAKAITDRQLLVDKQKAKEKADLFRDQTQAKAEGDVDKLAYAYSKQYDLPLEEAREMAGRAITQLQEARTTELKAKVAQRQQAYELHYKTYIESVRHHKELEARAKEAGARGDKALAIRIQKAADGTAAISKSMSADISQQKEINSEIMRLEGIVTNPLANADPNIQKYRNNLDDLTKQWYKLNDNINAKKEKLDEIGADIEEKRLTGGDKKGLLGPKQKDESGYHKGQEVDGAEIGQSAGTKYVYQGLSGDGQAIFHKKK